MVIVSSVTLKIYLGDFGTSTYFKLYSIIQSVTQRMTLIMKLRAIFGEGIGDDIEHDILGKHEG